MSATPSQTQATLPPPGQSCTRHGHEDLLRDPPHRMHLSLLLLLVAMAVVRCVAMVPMLHGFRGCAVREFTFVAQKPGCKSLRISTEACWGRCHTWEKPVVEPPSIQRHHRVCTYSRWRPMIARLPGCLPNVSPLYHYPLALLCHCAACSTVDTECETY